jgi:hypothetical protein
MAKKQSEAGLIEEYLRSESSEKARQHLLYPFLKLIFPGKLKIEGDANGADAYIEGKLIVESKTSDSQWLEGFYQALHYQRKFGLSYNTIMVVAHKFVAIWKLNKLPEYATILAHTANINDAPNKVGKDNAKKTQPLNIKEIKDTAFFWLDPKMLAGDIFDNAKHLAIESFEVLKVLKNLDSDRLQINKHNFIQTIERMKPFFEKPIDAVHAFYTLVAYWDITSVLTERPNGSVCLTGFKGNKSSEDIQIEPRNIYEFKKFVENQYIFTNEGSGLTADYYFSRFDEVIATIDPEYVKQHGIFFTNDYLSKFALWFAQHHFPGDINEDYVVFDPAGGSGNLVSSWRGKLKHKIVSELQPDLLRTIEKRMKADPFHIDTGFTIIPKTSDNIGLNFLDRSAEVYLNALTEELQHKNVALNKPIAFLLNPPYKNTDENVLARENTNAEYTIHESILLLTGEDAGKERYLAFLGQILNIAKVQAQQNHDLKPIVMIFTPTSWLLPRPTYVGFRREWDQFFHYHSGFIVTSNEWFKLGGKWPLAFTIWQYDDTNESKENSVKVFDYTNLKLTDLATVSWLADNAKLEKELQGVSKKSKLVTLDNVRGDIRNLLPLLKKGKVEIQQPRYDYSHAKKESDFNKIVSGFPLSDEERHFKLKRKCGDVVGAYIGFYDDNTPVRVNEDSCQRMTSKPNKVWFRLDNVFININQTKVLNGAPDKYGFCAYDLPSAKATFSWFAITKALNGNYPLWANQYDIWAPNIPEKLAYKWYSLCFAFVLAENRCVVTKFEKDNPVLGAPEVFVDNPLCPTNKESFWSTTLAPFVIANEAKQSQNDITLQLIYKITDFYKHWNKTYTQGQFLQNVGLHNEPYFKYFNYPDFLTPYSGIIQIKKYADQESKFDLQQYFNEISELTKQVKAELLRMLVEDFKYFE